MIRDVTDRGKSNCIVFKDYIIINFKKRDKQKGTEIITLIISYSHFFLSLSEKISSAKNKLFSS